MNTLKELMETLTAPLILAVFGGIARVCRYGAQSWRHFAGSVVVSSFTGVVVHLIIQESNLSTSLQAAIVAASGYSGGAILDTFVSGIINHIQQFPNNHKNNGE